MDYDRTFIDALYRGNNSELDVERLCQAPIRSGERHLLPVEKQLAGLLEVASVDGLHLNLKAWQTAS